MPGNLEKKVAAVTGAASGIGLACAEAMIAEGATVAFVDRDREALDRVCGPHGDAAVPVEIDLLDSGRCNQMVARIEAAVGPLDIFHANAGTYIGGDLVDADPDSIDKMLNLNVNVVMKNVQAVLGGMKERGVGDIIVTASVAGHFPVPWEPVYASSKWAITCFVQTLRRQVNNRGVRVAQISTGPVVSALLADWPEENLKKAKASGSLIEPSEVAEGLIFMLSRPRNVTIRDMIILPSNFDI